MIRLKNFARTRCDQIDGGASGRGRAIVQKHCDTRASATHSFPAIELTVAGIDRLHEIHRMPAHPPAPSSALNTAFPSQPARGVRGASIRLDMTCPADFRRTIARISSVFDSAKGLLICGLWVRFPPGSPPLDARAVFEPCRSQALRLRPVSGGGKTDSCGGRKSDSRQHGQAAG